ncbi:MAG: NAD-dependent epimerase/dehydratase family protein [Chthoniobacterales bacterium]
MPRILIAGCGYLGQATADSFVGGGCEVEGWTRSAEAVQKLSAKPYRARAIDLSDEHQVAGCEGEFDAVIHCASTRGGGVELYRQVYLEGLRNLLSRFGSSRILFVSSTSVYAQSGGEWVTEQSAAEPKHSTGQVLREAEQLALEHCGIVVRLAGIYGPGRSHLLKTFLAGEATIDPENDRFINQIHREDAAGAIAFLLHRQSIQGEIFNVVDDQPISQSECYRWLAGKLDRPLPPAGASAKQRKRGRSNKRVSNAKLRSLGWNPRYSTFAQGMENSALSSFGL